MNQVILIGRSGANAELKYSQAGKPLLNLSVATSERIQGTEGEYKTSWHRVVAFGRMAEALAPKILKGCRLTVVGRLNYNEWTDKNGNKQKSADILAQQIEVGQSASPPRSQETVQQQTSSFQETGTNDFDDIPF